MATITLKGIPASLHRTLKRRAAQNHRSMNGEVLAALEETLDVKKRNVDAILREAKKIRDSLKFSVTPEEIDAAKREGRA
jgi:plasmid stability protein